MVPKIIAKGTSFKGAAAYLLHDKGNAISSERVAWTEARNLMTDDPQIAWRIMAATALDQDRLKAQAGVKSTGRKSAQSVLHLSLAWHPDEAKGLSREEMTRAAIAAMKAIGADDRQALFIAHSDEAHPHLHILCNRVSPQTGIMLSSSNDRLKLSKWAESYERERGKILCEDRAINNERRAEGNYVKGQRNRARHIIEAERVDSSPANDNTAPIDALRKEQTAKDRALAEQSRASLKGRREAWSKLHDDHARKKDAIATAGLARFKIERSRIDAKYHDLRRSQNAGFEIETSAFQARDISILGRVQNTLKAVSLSKQVRGEESGNTIGKVFRIISSAGARLEELEKDQARRKAALSGQHRREVRQAAIEIGQERKADLARARSEFSASRSLLIERQRVEKEQIQNAWKERTIERTKAWEKIRAHMLEVRPQFTRAASPTPTDTGSGGNAREAIYKAIIEDYLKSPPSPANDRDHDRERD